MISNGIFLSTKKESICQQQISKLGEDRTKIKTNKIFNALWDKIVIFYETTKTNNQLHY